MGKRQGSSGVKQFTNTQGRTSPAPSPFHMTLLNIEALSINTKTRLALPYGCFRRQCRLFLMGSFLSQRQAVNLGDQEMNNSPTRNERKD